VAIEKPAQCGLVIQTGVAALQFGVLGQDSASRRNHAPYEQPIACDLNVSAAYPHYLSGLCGRPVFISEARQKIFVEVNEEGTEAAAATIMSLSEGIERNPFEMIVDRPFLFVIHHSDRQGSGSILFMGVVFDPGASSPEL
jgi:hypothetical protein